MIGAERLKVLSVIGTRPEAIKMAPLIRTLAGCPDVNHCLVVTGQHRELLDQVLEFFSLTADFDLAVMTEGQSLGDITSRVLQGLSKVFKQVDPDVILVHGDTTTTFAGALAAFYERKPVGHVEAGLRTGDPLLPYPEEMNRRLTGALAGLHFAPTEGARRNLLAENVSASDIFVTGNTAIDAVQTAVSDSYRFPPHISGVLRSGKRIVLVTAHRREHWGEPLRQICLGLRQLAGQADNITFVFPVHPNPGVRAIVNEVLAGDPRFLLTGPLDYGDMANLMSRSCLVLTDSGGLQEEAPSLGVPVLVLREKTERPEAVEAGTVKLVGTSAGRIAEEGAILLNDQRVYEKMARAVNPYGDGSASRRISEALLFRFGRRHAPPVPFAGSNRNTLAVKQG